MKVQPYTSSLTRNDVDIDFPPLDSLQDATNLYEVVIALGTGGSPVAAPDMIFTAAWTTASSGDVIATATSILAATPPSITATQNTAGSPIAVTVEDALIAGGVLDPSVDGLTGLDNALLMEGSISLPYTAAHRPMVLTLFSMVGVHNVDNPLATAAAIDLGATSVEPNNTICAAINPALGDYGADTERYLTWLNPVPMQRDMVALDVQITVPNTALGMPPGPWPVVIMQHGITSQKEDMLALTGALAAAGFATFAIDHPLHGSRGLISAALGGIEANATHA